MKRGLSHLNHFDESINNVQEYPNFFLLLFLFHFELTSSVKLTIKSQIRSCIIQHLTGGFIVCIYVPKRICWAYMGFITATLYEPF